MARLSFLRPIAHSSKVLNDSEMKYGAPKAKMFAVVKIQGIYAQRAIQVMGG